MKKTISMLAVAVLFALATACGSPASQRAGLYTGTGTVSFTFNTASGLKNSTMSLEGDVTAFEGASSDLVVKITDQCSLKFDMEDFETATVVPGSSCTETYPAETLVYTYSTGTLRFTKDTATFTGSGSFVDTYDGSTNTGTFNETINLTKVSK